jgi:hypothetical protein
MVFVVAHTKKLAVNHVLAEGLKQSTKLIAVATPSNLGGGLPPPYRAFSDIPAEWGFNPRVGRLSEAKKYNHAGARHLCRFSVALQTRVEAG